MSMQLHNLIASFKSYIKVEKGLSANTLEAYERDLKKLQAFADLSCWPLSRSKLQTPPAAS